MDSKFVSSRVRRLDKKSALPAYSWSLHKSSCLSTATTSPWNTSGHCCLWKGTASVQVDCRLSRFGDRA
jgi:hypothetical protein